MSEEKKKKSSMPEAEEEMLKPLWVANKIVERPCLVCWGCFIFIMILGFIDGLVFALSEDSERTWFVEESKEVYDYDTVTLAQEALSDAGGDDAYTIPQTQQDPQWTIQWMFELNNYNKKIDENNPSETDYWILTPENLQTILSYEEQNTNDPDWVDQFCFVVDTETFDCDYDSIARDVAVHFDYDFESMTTEDIRSYVWYLYTTSDSPGTIESSFNPEFSTTNQTFVYRSFLRGAKPIGTSTTRVDTGNGTIVIKESKYKNDNDKDETQDDKYIDYVVEFWDDITVKHNAQKKDDGIRIVFFEGGVFNEEFNILLLQSMGWVVGAIAAVLFWVTVHLESILLSCMALTQINLSFPAAFFIYRFILQIDNFDTLSTLIIFVLLGVGADDVFVFTDAWRQSVIFVEDKTDLKQRMSFAYRRAAKAMLVTQATTFFAFLATSAALIMPISAFGLWSACIILCNYVLVITMFPAMLILHHIYIRPWERKYCCCCCKDDDEEEEDDAAKDFPNRTKSPRAKSPRIPPINKKRTKSLSSPRSKSGMSVELAEISDDEDDDTNTAKKVAKKAKSPSGDGKPPPLPKRQSTVLELSVEYGCLEGFFAITWAKWITKARYVILISFCILFGIAVWQASSLEQQNGQEEWFTEEHYMKTTLEFFDKFSSSEETDLIYVTILFGAKGVNREGTVKWDPTDYGKLKWDNSFDLSSPEAQEFFNQTCDDLTRSEKVFQPTSVICPIFGFIDYLESIGETFPYTYLDPDDPNYDADVQFDMFATKMYNFSQSTDGQYYIQDKLIYVQSADDRKDNRDYLRYIAIGIYTDLEVDADLDDQRDAQDDWYDYRKDTFTKNKDCPDNVCKPVITSFNWCWMRTNEEFVRSAFQGIGIALPLAFVVLLISTQNWIMSIFATLDIIGVMICELGVMHVAGWKFGVSESIAIVIIIGFSVDYVVHLANAYLESTGGIRSERLSFALLTMGISVCSGALTTFLGGIFLTFPPLLFFVKMGVLIMTTIFFSLAWSMLFFIALLSAFGPEHDKGDIPLCKKVNTFISENFCNNENENENENENNKEKNDGKTDTKDGTNTNTTSTGAGASSDADAAGKGKEYAE